MDIIIEKIIERRKEKKMSQRMLAYTCGIPQSTLARIETGKTAPQLDTLKKILKQLDLELNVESRPSSNEGLRRWEGLSFCAYWKDELVSKVEVRGSIAYITRFVLHPVKQIFYKDKMDLYSLSLILEGRCWERGRIDIYFILKKLGLDYYDPLEIVKRTHGVRYDDFLWFQFEGENYCYKDMKSGRCR